MKKIIIMALSAAVVLSSCEKKSKMYHRPEGGGGETPVPEAEVGKPLPKWQEGCLDIHHISSGRGECTYYIFPDGTTMLADAGEIVPTITPKPNATVAAYEVYGNYVKYFLPEGHTNLDYMFLTHFHIDHIGSHTVREAGEGGYVHVGVTAVYDLVKFDHLIDRGYPNYGSDGTIGAPDTETFPNYQIFVKKLEQEKTVKLEGFTLKADLSYTQFPMLYNPSEYDFIVTNIVGNGNALGMDDDGKPVIKTGTIQTSGNPNSCGFHMSYGKFDYIACGDLTSTPQNMMANNYYANYVSSLEVFKGNHHLYSNSWGSGMQGVGFKPQVVTAVCTGTPDTGVVGRAIELPSDVFLTYLSQKDLDDNPVFQQCKGCNGHIVTRVAKGGEQFYVYVLDDSDMAYNVKAIYGPYISYN